MQSNRSSFRIAQRFLAGGDGGGLDVAVSDQLDHTHPLHVVVFDHKQSAEASFSKVFDVVKRLAQVFGSRRLLNVIERALLQARAVVVLRQ